MRSCSELTVGDRIQALGEALAFRGEVTAIHHPMDLFWAVDSIGERRVFDFGTYCIYLSGEVED